MTILSSFRIPSNSSLCVRFAKGELEDKFVVAVACGTCHTVALTADGDVYLLALF